MKKNQDIWEETISKLLGDDNPCKLCLVQVTCDKSFTRKNRSACEELAKKLELALERVRNESKS
jgi:hypothetical protein